jgi:hypothetical protein
MYYVDCGVNDQLLNQYYTCIVEGVRQPLIRSVEAATKPGKVVFTVITQKGNFNRLRVGTNLSLTNNLAVSSTYVETDNAYIWTIMMNTPDEDLDLYFDLRDSNTNKYVKEHYSYRLKLDELEPIITIKDVEIEEQNSKLVFAITTASFVNRVKLAYADAQTAHIKYTDKYTINQFGEYVWTITINNPGESVSYAVDARDKETKKYIRDYYYCDYKYSEGSITNISIMSVNHVVENNKIIFTITTLPNTNRVKVAYADNPKGYIKYTNNYSINENGNYVWSITIPNDSNSYVFDTRNIEKNIYNKDYYSYSL